MHDRRSSISLGRSVGAVRKHQRLRHMAGLRGWLTSAAKSAHPSRSRHSITPPWNQPTTAQRSTPPSLTWRGRLVAAGAQGRQAALHAAQPSGRAHAQLRGLRRLGGRRGASHEEGRGVGVGGGGRQRPAEKQGAEAAGQQRVSERAEVGSRAAHSWQARPLRHSSSPACPAELLRRTWPQPRSSAGSCPHSGGRPPSRERSALQHPCSSCKQQQGGVAAEGKHGA